MNFRIEQRFAEPDMRKIVRERLAGKERHTIDELINASRVEAYERKIYFYTRCVEENGENTIIGVFMR